MRIENKIFTLIIKRENPLSKEDCMRLFIDSNQYWNWVKQIQSEIEQRLNKKQHYQQTLANVSNFVSLKELQNLIFRLVEIENAIGSAGSVSPIIPVFKSFILKNGYAYVAGGREGALMLCNGLINKPNSNLEKVIEWVLNNTNNDYVPFGTSTIQSKDLASLKLENEGHIYRTNEHYKRQAKEQEAKRIRDEERKRIAENNLKNTIQAQEKNKKEKTELRKLNTYDRLNHILNDKSKPIYFYQNELAILKHEDLNEEDKNVIKKIVALFKEKEHRKIEKVKKHLIEISKE